MPPSIPPVKFVAVGQSLIKRDVRDYPSRTDIRQIIQSANIAFTNYEGTIRGSYGGWPVKEGPVQAADALVLDTLQSLGFNVLSLANNHAFDLGPGGILSTLEEVKKRGFLHAGTGTNKAEAAAPGYRETPYGRIALVAMDSSPLPDYCYAQEERPGINPLRVREMLHLGKDDYQNLRAISARLEYEKRKAMYIRYGFRTTFKDTEEFYGLPFTPGERTEEYRFLDPHDRDRNLQAIETAAREADFVAVYAHHHYWETAWEQVPSWFREFARQCIEAGANVFVSHGVPLLQGIEIYKGRPIFYSLGNFIFHSAKKAAYDNAWIWKSVIASCVFDERGDITTIDLYPIVLGGREALEDNDLPRDTPCLVDEELSQSILARLADLSLPFATSIEISGRQGHINLSDM